MTEPKILSRDEVLELLSGKAQEGSTSAMIALERALRARESEQNEIHEVIDRILGETARVKKRIPRPNDPELNAHSGGHYRDGEWSRRRRGPSRLHCSGGCDTPFLGRLGIYI